MLIHPKQKWRRSRVLFISPYEFDMPIIFDTKPNFDIITFSYENKKLDDEYREIIKPIDHFSINSEFWGETFFRLCKEYKGKFETYGFLNSDIYISISEINRCFDLGDIAELDFWQPSLSQNSHFSHSFLLNDPSKNLETVPFIEIMMPFLSSEVINSICEINKFTKSGWGMDNFLFPKIQESKKLKEPTVIHACQGFHFKPISSITKRFSNGMTAFEEMEALKIELQ
jgi:hypothetical protein